MSISYLTKWKDKVSTLTAIVMVSSSTVRRSDGTGLHHCANQLCCPSVRPHRAVSGHALCGGHVRPPTSPHDFCSPPPANGASTWPGLPNRFVAARTRKSQRTANGRPTVSTSVPPQLQKPVRLHSQAARISDRHRCETRGSFRDLGDGDTHQHIAQGRDMIIAQRLSDMIELEA